jgi:hypothetical protein
MLLPMSVLERPPDYLRRRPPTAVYPDRQQMAEFRDREFPATATDRERVFWINLEGGFFAPGALKEMIVPLGEAVRNGIYGSAAIVVVSSDDGTVEFLEALAEKHALPIFLSSSPDASLSQARPLGTLTTAEAETFRLIRSAGGEATSARIADLAGIEVNAAVNRLSALAKKGYVHRVSRSRREGDAFVDLLSAAEPQTSAAPIESAHTSSVLEEFRIPNDIRENIQILATMEGTNPGDVLLRAWTEFLDRHRDVLDSQSEDVRRMLRENDREGLAELANRRNRERAQRAVQRIKR